MIDDVFMDRALFLANLGRGNTSPNPMVGAVVVSEEGVVVGTGYHEQAGMDHAEVRALNVAGELARSATLYCTLEPCSHFGRTSPCVERIIDAGISRVVVGSIDPNPEINGSGIDYLRKHGLKVDVGVRNIAAAKLNEAFFTWIKKKRSFVTMKITTSLDGCVAKAINDRTLLTSQKANKIAHKLRSEVDAVAVGSRTLMIDDPLLTIRYGQKKKSLMRVVFDRHLRVSLDAKIFSTLDSGPVIVITSEKAIKKRPESVELFRDIGVKVEVVEPANMLSGVRHLAEMDVTSLLLEGGPTIHRSAWKEGIVDRVQRFIAPVTLGSQAVPWFQDDTLMARLKDLHIETCGPDILVEGYV